MTKFTEEDSTIDATAQATNASIANASIANTSIESIAAKAHQVIDKLADAATQTSDQLDKKSDEYKKMYSNASNTVSEYVQQKPLQSLGIAIAIGFAAGWLLKRR